MNPTRNYFGQGQLGAVANTYRISKYEVTNDQYAEFLNAVAATDSFPGADPNLYNSTMDITQSGSDWELHVCGECRVRSESGQIRVVL